MHLNFENLNVGEPYDRPFLANLWGYKDWHAIGRGAVTPKNDKKIVFFVTKEKQDVLTQYMDNLEDDLLYMEGEKFHSSDNRIINSNESSDELYLFYREKHHAPFIYYGRIYLISYEKKISKPSKFVFSISKTDAISMRSLLTENITHGQVDMSFIPDMEGRQRIIQHVTYERSRRNRNKAIEIHGTKCKVCEFDFNSFYGQDLARDYIEIHHIKPINESYGTVNPETDLLPLCSNCHSMIHRDQNRFISVIDLGKIIKRNRV